MHRLVLRYSLRVLQGIVSLHLLYLLLNLKNGEIDVLTSFMFFSLIVFLLINLIVSYFYTFIHEEHRYAHWSLASSSLMLAICGVIVLYSYWLSIV